MPGGRPGRIPGTMPGAIPGGAPGRRPGPMPGGRPGRSAGPGSPAAAGGAEGAGSTGLGPPPERRRREETGAPPGASEGGAAGCRGPVPGFPRFRGRGGGGGRRPLRLPDHKRGLLAAAGRGAWSWCGLARSLARPLDPRLRGQRGRGLIRGRRRLGAQGDCRSRRGGGLRQAKGGGGGQGGEGCGSAEGAQGCRTAHGGAQEVHRRYPRSAPGSSGGRGRRRAIGSMPSRSASTTPAASA